MDLSRVVPKSRLVADLHALGVRPGDIVMTHESVKAIGWVVGGPSVVIDALLTAVGPDGTLLKYVGSEDGAYSMAEWPPEIQAAYRDELPTYDPATTRARREWGILCEYLRSWPGAKRSSHPDSSFAAIGKRATWLVEKHPTIYPFGPETPMARLVEAKGKVLLLGSPLDSVTVIHHAEHLAKVPGKRIVRYREPVLRGGTRTWVDCEEYDTSRGIVPWDGPEDYFATIVKAFRSDGLCHQGRVGHAESLLLDAEALVTYAVAWMEKNLTSGTH